jgi:hypothetical protein
VNFFNAHAARISLHELARFKFFRKLHCFTNHLQETSMSKCKPMSVTIALAYLLLRGAMDLNGQQAKPETPTENIFQMGLILQDSNGDQISDVVCGHVIVPKSPSAAENAAAANFAARLGYETGALTLPLVVSAAAQVVKNCISEKANLWVGRDALTPTTILTLKINRSQRDTADGVMWRVERKRPILPLAPLPVAQAGGVKQ